MLLRRKKTRFPWLLLFLADFLAIVAAYYTTIFLRFHSDLGEKLYGTLPKLIDQPAGKLGPIHQAFYYESALRIILILTAVVCFLYALRRLYAGRRYLLNQPIAWNVIVANVMALGIFYTYWYLTRNVYHPRSMFASIMIFNIVFCIGFRRIAVILARQMQKRWGVDRCRALLVGQGEEADFIATVLKTLQPHGIVCANQIGLDKEALFENQLRTIIQALQSTGADMLISADKTLSVPQIMRILEETDTLGIPAKILSEKLDILVSRTHLPCDSIHGVPLVHFNAPSRQGKLGVVRRTMTFVVAAVALLLLAPLMLLIALLIRMTSPGPARFVQERIGVNRRSFRMYKFRTMYNKAEELQAQVEEFNESSGALFKIKHDPRITPIGRFLRRFSMDELPQFFNVLRGEMAIVGPRPLPRRDFENYYEDWHYSRHGGLPGLTCLWQISGRSDLDFHNMCILDVFYLRNHTWIMDIEIVLHTTKVVLFGTGAY